MPNKINMYFVYILVASFRNYTVIMNSKNIFVNFKSYGISKNNIILLKRKRKSDLFADSDDTAV